MNFTKFLIIFLEKFGILFLKIHEIDSFHLKSFCIFWPTVTTTTLKNIPFLFLGWRRESQPANDLHVPNDWFHSFANAIQWDPNSSLINSADLTENNENNNTDLTEKSFYLDSEAVDIRGPMEISVLPEKIILFCGESVARTLTKSDSGTSTSNNRKWWQRTTTANSLVSVKTTNKF